MTLAIGTKLGRYEIRSKIGEGGMGEVYRARDEKLNRDVAIKVLPAAFSEHKDRLSRFEQEAQAAGALNHPNILAIYDVDVYESAPFVVAELLSGETLRDRLRRGPLSQRPAVDVALQVARGLAAAHDKGIVHRDLKPENVFITNDDRVKILDFGLAKLIGPVDGSQPQTDVPTRQQHTDPGTILGTVGYMSPEQARAEYIDHRSDIFALGTILYEMLSGERAFVRTSAVETLNAIIKEEPAEFTSLSTISPALHSIVRHCLEKKRERRFQSANDVAFALETLSASAQSNASFAESPAARAKLTREHLAWAIAGMLLLITAITLLFYFRSPIVHSYAIQFLIFPPENSSFVALDLPFPVAISPDGKRLAVVVRGGQRQLLVRSLDSLTALPLANTEGAQNPFWSPDGRFIAFFADGKLKRIGIEGGVPSVICDAVPTSNSGTWSSENIILFTTGSNEKGILKVSASGGDPVVVMRPNEAEQEIYYFWPSFLPDGRHFLYLSGKGKRTDTTLRIASLDSNETKELMKINSRSLYSPPGYLLYVREGFLMARPFDAKSLSFTGDEVSIADHIGNFGSTGNAYFAVSANGEVVSYLSGQINSRLVWLDRTGKQIGMLGEPNTYRLARLSPDGKKLAVDIVDPKDSTNDIWINDFERGTFTRFTYDPGLENGSLWFRDGRGIVYAHDRDGAPHLFQKMLSDPGEGQILLPPARTGPQYPLDFTPDGQFMIYQELRADTGTDLLILPMTGERKPVPFATTKFNEQEARISPDGKWVAFACDQTGHREIYVQKFSGGGERIQISNGGGSLPRWNRNGKELFFLSGQKMMSVSVNAGETFEPGSPVQLFQFDGADYDVTPDGQRFLLRTTAGVPPLPLTVATAWSTNLKR